MTQQHTKKRLICDSRMRRLSVLLLLLLYSVGEKRHCVYAYNVSVNSNRGFLFGDVLEPLCSVNTTGQNLTDLQTVELFHEWEKYTSAQLSGKTSAVSDYRKAMPCFPGPNLNLTTPNDTLPVYPNCDSFVNVSTATMAEVEDLLAEVGKGDGPGRLDVSLKSVMNSLSNRLRNLIDYLPEGATRNKTENLLTSLVGINTRPIASDVRSFDPSLLLACFNISSHPGISSLLGQNIGTLLCSSFSICSFASVSSNQCLSKFNISEQQYDSIVNKTVKELIGGTQMDGGTIGRLFGELSRFKRTPKPPCENCTDGDESWEEVKMDGREEGSGEEASEHRHSFTASFREFMESSGEEKDGSEDGMDGNFTRDEDDDDVRYLLSEDPHESSGILDSRDNQTFVSSVFSEPLKSLLATELNTSIVEYGATFLNDTALKSRIAGVIPSLGAEFTVGQLLKRINVTESSQLIQLFSALRSVMGESVPDVSAILEKMEKMNGDSVEGILEELLGESSNEMIEKIKEKFNETQDQLSTNSSISDQIQDFLQKASTLPTHLLNLLNSTDSSKFSDALRSFNSSAVSDVLSRLNLS